METRYNFTATIRSLIDGTKRTLLVSVDGPMRTSSPKAFNSALHAVYDQLRSDEMIIGLVLNNREYFDSRGYLIAKSVY